MPRSRYKSGVINLIQNREQEERKACKRYATSQLRLERSTDIRTQYVGLVDRKHCREYGEDTERVVPTGGIMLL